jgi:hypothetical protein
LKFKKLKIRKNEICPLFANGTLMLLCFALLTLFAGCMHMKHEMKTDMTDHAAGVV